MLCLVRREVKNFPEFSNNITELQDFIIFKDFILFFFLT